MGSGKPLSRQFNETTTAFIDTTSGTCIHIIAPGTRVEILIRIRVRVALDQLHPLRHRLVDGDPVEAHGGKDHRLTAVQVVVDGNTKQGMTVVLLPVAGVLVAEGGMLPAAAL